MPEPAPFFADIAGAPAGTAAVWLGAGRTRLRAALTPPGQRGLALILPGRTEYAEKYGPVMTRLAGLGLGSAVIDWRGQGLSDRPDGSTALGHVGDFAEYAADLSALLAHVSGAQGPRVMIAHSMGGCIGLSALHAGLSVRGAVFSAPMWGLELRPMARRAARGLSWAATRMGLGKRHAPGGDARFYVETETFAVNLLTSDRAEWDRLRRQLAGHPELGLGGPSHGWLDAAFREMDRLAAAPTGRFGHLPVLGFLGAEEALVSPAAIRAGMAGLPGGTLVELPGARHEAFFEAPGIQDRVWAEIGAFLDRIGV